MGNYKEKIVQYKERQKEAKNGIKNRFTSKRKVFLVIIPTIIMLFVLTSVFFIIKENERVYNEQRYAGLDYYENTKAQVLSDMLKYFYINSPETWSKARTDMKIKEEDKHFIFGYSYDERKFADFEKVKVVDISYTLKDTEKVTYYMLVEFVDTQGKKYNANILVDTDSGYITKIEGF